MQSFYPIDPHMMAESIFNIIIEKMKDINLNEPGCQAQVGSIVDNAFNDLNDLINCHSAECLNNLHIKDLPTLPPPTNTTTDISAILSYKQAANYLSEFNCMEYETLKHLIFTTMSLTNIKDQEGKNILHVAIQRKDLPMMKLIIALDPQLLTSCVEEKTLLHFAVNDDACSEVIDWLTKNATLLFPSNSPNAFQIDVNAQDKEGNTALHYALRTNDRVMAFKLKDELKASLDIENRLGLTPAEIAISTMYRLITLSLNPSSKSSLEEQIIKGPYFLHIQTLHLLAQAFCPSKGLDNMPSLKEILQRQEQLTRQKK